jgi:hypothetical protein
MAVDRGVDGITFAGSTVMGGITFGGMVKAPLVEAPEAAIAPEEPLANAPLPGVVAPLAVVPIEPVPPGVVELPDVPPSPLVATPEPGVPPLGEVLAPLGPTNDPDEVLSEPVEDFVLPSDEQAANAHAQARATAKSDIDDVRIRLLRTLRYRVSLDASTRLRARKTVIH